MKWWESGIAVLMRFLDIDLGLNPVPSKVRVLSQLQASRRLKPPHLKYLERVPKAFI
jgi:hypothetical protein